MFITDKLVYIQLQKTGCTHIAKLLQATVGGRQRGKHNAAPRRLRRSSRITVSSIRDPWEWYVSLWSAGCDGKGGLRVRACRKQIPRHFKDLFRFAQPADLRRSISREIHRDPTIWRDLYADSRDPARFRRWLHTIHHPRFRYDFGEGFGMSSVHGFAGIYTFRYLKWCCAGRKRLYSGSLRSPEDLETFERKNCYIDRWIRNESLEEDLIDVLESADEPLCPSDRNYIFSCSPTNTSSRSESTDSYHDAETVELVRKRDRIIVDKFGYSPPDPAG